MGKHVSKVARASGGVDLALVLAIDCSSSIDSGDYRLQMDGIAEALRHPALPVAIAAGSERRIALALVQWSTRRSQTLSLPWTVVQDAADLEAIARLVSALERQWLPGGTGLAAAISYCAALHDAIGDLAARRVIDVSGDGDDNEGGNVEEARDAALRNGVIINGLPVLTGSKIIEKYYRTSVIGGPGAFLVPATTTRDFGDAMTRKLLREVNPHFAA